MVSYSSVLIQNETARVPDILEALVTAIFKVQAIITSNLKAD
jgi:hypothetical protein